MASSGSRPEEHEPPGRGLADERGDRGTDDPGDDPGSGHHREHLRLEALRQPAADRHVGGGRDRPAPQALDQPGPDQDRHRRRQSADREPEREQPEPDRERLPEGHPVERAAGDDGAHEIAQEERAEHPAVELELAELGRDLGHHRADGERLERNQGDGRDEPDGQAADARREQVGRAWCPGRRGGGGRGHVAIMPEGPGPTIASCAARRASRVARRPVTRSPASRRLSGYPPIRRRSSPTTAIWSGVRYSGLLNVNPVKPASRYGRSASAHWLGGAGEHVRPAFGRQLLAQRGRLGRSWRPGPVSPSSARSSPGRDRSPRSGARAPRSCAAGRRSRAGTSGSCRRAGPRS